MKYLCIVLTLLVVTGCSDSLNESKATKLINEGLLEPAFSHHTTRTARDSTFTDELRSVIEEEIIASEYIIPTAPNATQYTLTQKGLENQLGDRAMQFTYDPSNSYFRMKGITIAVDQVLSISQLLVDSDKGEARVVFMTKKEPRPPFFEIYKLICGYGGTATCSHLDPLSGSKERRALLKLYDDGWVVEGISRDFF